MTISRLLACLFLLSTFVLQTQTWAEAPQASSIQPQTSTQAETGKTNVSRFASWRNPEEASELQSTGPRMLQGLGLCLGIFLIGIYCAKRLRARGLVQSGRRLNMIERMPLGPKTSLVLVTLDGKEFVIAIGSESVQLIHAPESFSAEMMKDGLGMLSEEELRCANLA